MKKQKRFETREEITAQIDALKFQAKLKLSDAEILEGKATELIQSGHEGNILEGRKMRVDAGKLRRSIYLIETEKLPQLSHTLAAFDTVPMFGERGVAMEEK